MKQTKLFIFLITLVLISNVVAWSTTTFNNSLTTENLTFTGNQNITRYLAVPSNKAVIFGYLNISGGTNYGFCYQETANVSTDCGGLSTGNYNTDTVGYFYINYTKPTNAVLGSFWLVKYGLTSAPYNTTIPASCFNYYTNKIALRIINMKPTAFTGDSIGQCYNGTWSNITTKSDIGGCSGSSDAPNMLYDGDYLSGASKGIGDWSGECGLGNINEEAIYWNTTFYPENTSLKINNLNVWNYTSTFNISNNVTNNLKNYITNYLASCTYLSGYCNVPFIFHSDSVGSIIYSNLIFNDSGVIINSINYTNPISEGISSTIISNFTLSTPSSITLVYNGSTSTPTTSVVGNNYILTSNITTPLVPSDNNISFYYVFNIDGVNYYSNTYYQQINNVQLSINCSNGTNVVTIFNFDEESLNPINATVEYILTLEGSNGDIGYINGNSTGSNVSICSNIALNNSYNTYSLQLRYYSNSYYTYKTYNIQSSPTSNLPININLYYLNGTQFKIYYKDFYYITYPNAIMQIQRQYLSENTYRTVEIPKLDNNGNALATFNTNNIRYKIIVINNGQVLDTFEDIFPACQNLVLGTCEINLRGKEKVSTTTNGDFTYTLIKTNSSLILTYVIPSGTPRSITLSTNQYSRFLNNITTCSNSLFASGGTITCNYNQTVGDSIIDIVITNSDGSVLYSSITISEDLSGFFLLNNYFIGFVLILSLALMFVSSGVMLIIVAVVGLLFLGLIFILKGADLFTVTGSIAWIIIAVVLAIYSISKKEERT